MDDLYAKNLSDLTDPRTIWRTGVSQASQAAGELSQLPAGAHLGRAGLLPPLYHHRHGAGFADLGAPVSVSALSHQRQLPAAVCAAVSAGQYADHRGGLPRRGQPTRGSALEPVDWSLLAAV